ncbi:MAG: glycosyltransferase family 2 protein [Bacteroidota bacterium]
MNLSIVIPLFNEEESIPELCDWIARVCNANNFSYEIILIDDGSTDGSWEKVETLALKNNNIHGICMRRNYGKSAALQTGFEALHGDVVITMDADLQDSPDEIPSLYKMIVQDNFDLVSGWKQKRYDPLSKTIPTKLFNWATRKMSGIYLHDFNCGLKAYRKEVVKNIEVFGEMHRYIPVIASKSGFKKIGEKVVQHQKRKYGKTKFGMSRFINGFLDLLTVSLLTKYLQKPMHFFGTMGVISFFIGTAIALFLSIEKIFFNEPLSNRPLLLFSVLLIILGVQSFIIGLFGEMILRNSHNRNQYQIKKKIGL